MFLCVVSQSISAMNIAANQAIYPQTTTHMPYHNGAMIQSPIQQTASIVNHRNAQNNNIIELLLFLIFH
jgi:hypothetical protein